MARTSKPGTRRLALYFDVLVITDRGKTKAYKLVELPGDGRMARAWEFRRHNPPPGEVELYLVWLPPTGPRCTCPASRRGRGRGCRHASAVLKLIEAGRL